MQQAAIAYLRLVAYQDNVANGESVSCQSFLEQISQQATLHEERYKTEHRKQHAGAARDFIPDLQSEYGSGEQKEHAGPRQQSRADLVPKNQQFGWSIHSPDL